jgi:hypothetical protein
MKKLIILTLAFALILSAAAFASQTRVLTMGDNHIVLTDDANIWNWPSRLNNYPHLAVGEFGYNFGNNFNQFGVHWQFGDDQPWVLATYFDNDFAFQPFAGYPINTVEGFNLTNNRRIHAFYARAMGTNKFGARLSLFKSGYEDPSGLIGTAGVEQSFSYYEASLGLTASDDSWDIAVTGGFGTWRDKRNDTLYSQPDGLIDFSVLGRMFWGSSPNYNYVPHASIEYHKQGEDYWYYSGASVEMFNYTQMAIEVGIGQVYTPSTNVEAVLDLGLAIERNKVEYTDVATPANNSETKANFNSIPYFKLGLDAEVFSWLDARFGATSYWQWDKYEAGGTTAFKENYADNETFLGFGFHWGNLHVDTYTDPELFLNGFDFISGDGDGDMNFRISAVYDMM